MEKRVILAADELTLEQCLELGAQIGDRLYAIKIHNLYDRHGPSTIERLKKIAPWKVWIDAKLHDIPNTARLRAKSFADAGADILSVHASGGTEMMRAAKESGLIVYGVTVLTSLDEKEVQHIYGREILPTALRLGFDAKKSGLDGVVCSPAEVENFSTSLWFKGLELITPGIRSLGVDTGDQSRVDTPAGAIQSGSTRLVVGRQLTKAHSVLAAYTALETEISAALGQRVDKRI
jgi:orotidine-5'-phosphate decarboxylase